MNTTTDFTLWDEADATRRVIDAIRSAERLPLSERQPRRPGVYILGLSVSEARLAEEPTLAAYGQLLSEPVYGGLAQSLAERRGRHKNNLDKARGISSEDVWMASVPCSFALARYLEQVLIEELGLAWNLNALRGAGSKMAGRAREDGQVRPSPWDALHHRTWAGRPAIAQEGAVRARLAAYVAGLTTYHDLWPSLPQPAVGVRRLLGTSAPSDNVTMTRNPCGNAEGPDHLGGRVLR